MRLPQPTGNIQEYKRRHSLVLPKYMWKLYSRESKGERSVRTVPKVVQSVKIIINNIEGS